VRRAETVAALAALLLLAAAGSLPGAVCPVPSAGHPTLGSAVADPACTTAALGATTLAENVEIGRDLVVQGGGAAVSVLAGSLRASGATTSVTLASLAVDGTAPGVAGCWANLVASEQGAEILAGPEVEVRAGGAPGGACRIFVDGFESGSALAWSAAVP